jgi:hypothetical protein
MQNRGNQANQGRQLFQTTGSEKVDHSDSEAQADDSREVFHGARHVFRSYGTVTFQVGKAVASDKLDLGRFGFFGNQFYKHHAARRWILFRLKRAARRKQFPAAQAALAVSGQFHGEIIRQAIPTFKGLGSKASVGYGSHRQYKTPDKK